MGIQGRGSSKGVTLPRGGSGTALPQAPRGHSGTTKPKSVTTSMKPVPNCIGCGAALSCTKCAYCGRLYLSEDTVTYSHGFMTDPKLTFEPRIIQK